MPTAASGPSPAAAARRAERALRALSDPRGAAGVRTVFKESDVIEPLGVRTPVVRRMARELSGEVRGVWTVTEALAFADRMVGSRYHEAKVLGMLVLGRYRKSLDRRVIAAVRRWIDGGLLANWAAIDAVASLILAPLLAREPALVATVARWARARNRWRRRAAAVTLVPLVRRGRELDTAYGVAETLAGDREDLVQKACGWLLREAGRTDRPRLEAFLRRLGPGLSRTALRYAIEHFPEGHRRRLLRATRA